ncbi:MAG: enoyl-CoA hydratase-related protein [Egibacteraceae bacterium]
MPITRVTDVEGIATLLMDDGKVNALDARVFHELGAAFDACADDAAIVLAGREGVFSAGLNMRLLPQLDRDGLIELMVTFARAVHRIWLEPRPVVAAATGHAIAGGTMLAMACDHAVAAKGEFRWGLIETSIGFVVPSWVIALARGNLRADRLDDLILPGAAVSPEQAVECGFADALAPPDQVVELALAKARQLSALPRPVYAATKRRLRGEASAAALAHLERDTADMFPQGTAPGLR